MLERNYIIPLRREWLKVPRYQRSRKAIRALGEFVSKHMKSDNVKIGSRLNEHIWENGTKNPPHKIEVTCLKEDDGKCYVELKCFPVKEKIEEKKEKPKKEIKEETKTGEKEDLTKKSIEGLKEPEKEKLAEKKFTKKKDTVKLKESKIYGRTQKN